LHQHDPPVVHGDVKPANIVVCDGGRAVLVDLGSIRQHIDAPPPERTSLYQAPEIVAGEAFSAASDVFSLGVTAYEMLTGDRPTPGVVPPMPVPDAERSRVIAAIDRATSIDPARRQQSASEFVAELAGVPTYSPPSEASPVFVAHNGDVPIAYHVLGRGPVDILL